jgi:hypothetical protein
MTFFPIKEDDKSAFGELSVSQHRSEVMLSFPYGLNPATAELRINGPDGYAQFQNSQATLFTGAGTNNYACIHSIRTVKYDPGHGAVIRFSARFDEGQIGSEQLVGLGDRGDGFFFGYRDSTFGIMKKRGGRPDVRRLTITTASTTNENVTITLDGYVKNDIAVTNSGNITTTVNEIASADYSQVGLGWKAYATGDHIHFVSYDFSPRNGAYSISATTAAGNFTQDISGAIPEVDFIPQSLWNVDKADGTGEISAIDFTKGNVYQIKYQWLGYGCIFFYVEHPETGGFINVHIIHYSNRNIVPSIFNPSLPLHASVKNTLNTSNVSLSTASLLGAVDGDARRLGPRVGTAATLTGLGTSELPVITIRNKVFIDSVLNRESIALTYISVTNDHTKPIVANFYANRQLTNASFSDVSTGVSVMEVDSSSTASSGGSLLFTIGVGSGDSVLIPLTTDPDSGTLSPGNSFVVTAFTTSGTNANVTVSFNWVELI